MIVTVEPWCQTLKTCSIIWTLAWLTMTYKYVLQNAHILSYEKSQVFLILAFGIEILNNFENWENFRKRKKKKEKERKRKKRRRNLRNCIESLSDKKWRRARMGWESSFCANIYCRIFGRCCVDGEYEKTTPPMEVLWCQVVKWKMNMLVLYDRIWKF